jgi:hypothetical protein
MAKNTNLHTAKKAKNDEFYTQLCDIENELKYYRQHFVGKTVYCNCDDARESNFFKFFSLNFEFLGLKKLISTGYKENGKGVKLVYTGDKNGNKYPFQRVIGGSGMSASSTEVRELIRNGLVVYPLINSKVEKIIKDNGLYPSK